MISRGIRTGRKFEDMKRRQSATISPPLLALIAGNAGMTAKTLLTIAPKRTLTMIGSLGQSLQLAEDAGAIVYDRKEGWHLTTLGRNLLDQYGEE